MVESPGFSRGSVKPPRRRPGRHQTKKARSPTRDRTWQKGVPEEMACVQNVLRITCALLDTDFRGSITLFSLLYRLFTESALRGVRRLRRLPFGAAGGRVSAGRARARQTVELADGWSSRNKTTTYKPILTLFCKPPGWE